MSDKVLSRVLYPAQSSRFARVLGEYSTPKQTECTGFMCETVIGLRRCVIRVQAAVSVAGLCVTRRNTPVSVLRYGGGAGRQGPAG